MLGLKIDTMTNVLAPLTHSLWVFATFLTGDSSVPFSEFTAVIMLDDIVIGHYNADERSFVPATVQESVNVTEQITISTVCKGIHERMKTKAYYLIDYLKYTREPGPDPVIVVPSVLLLLGVFGILLAFKVWRRRYSQPEQTIYTPALAAEDQTTEQQQM